MFFIYTIILKKYRIKNLFLNKKILKVDDLRDKVKEHLPNLHVRLGGPVSPASCRQAGFANFISVECRKRIFLFYPSVSLSTDISPKLGENMRKPRSRVSENYFEKQF